MRERICEYEKELTGFASIDKPWLKYYPDGNDRIELPELSIYQLFAENMGKKEKSDCNQLL